jgi:drug/metabolite transporter (DMT)-like permease
LLVALALSVAVVGVSFSAIFIKLAQSPALVIATNRMLVAWVLLLVPTVLGARGRRKALGRREIAALGSSGLLLGVHFGVWTVSLDFTSVASSVVFVNTAPLWVALAEWGWWRRAPGGLVWGGIVLTLAGSALIGSHDLQVGGAALWGDALAVGGAVAMAGYLIVGRRLRQRLDTLTYCTAVYCVAWLTLLAWTTATGADVRAFPSSDAVWFVALAVFSTLGGHTLFNWALRHVPAGLVAVVLVGEPVGAAVLAWLILGQPVGPATALGGALILAGIYLTARGSGAA